MRLPAAFLVFVSALALVMADSVTVDKIEIFESRVLDGNILPQFLFSQGSVEGGATHVFIGGGRGNLRAFTPDDSNGPEIFEGAMSDTRSPQLPYLTQDQWTCERKKDTLPVVVLENESLRTYIAPTVAGKIWNTKDKKNNKDMFFDNLVHQPANIGALKAWAAGGLEFNWSPGIIGHSAFSESPVYVGTYDSERGPVVRVWEFDRYNSTVWQVDIMHSDDELWMHPKITNPNNHDLRGYWWTCVAHHVTPESRVLSPANHVAETASGAVRDAPWPYFAEVFNTSFAGLAPPLGNNVWLQDHSFLGNIIWGDYFLRIPDGERRYIAHVEDTGYFVWHGHTLNGTKFFTWGQTGPGRFMQDFLSGNMMPNRTGDYAELQTGPAPTQMQNWPLPALSTIEWTEVFKAGNTKTIAKETLQHKDHDVAIKAMTAWANSDAGVPQTKHDDMDAFLKGKADTPVSKILFTGMPWGELHESYLKKIEGKTEPLAPGAIFTGSFNHESKAWQELVDNKKFSEETLSHLPLSYQVGENWRELLQESGRVNGYTWLHNLYLGVIAAETGLVKEPLAYFEASMKQRPNTIAMRCIALLQQTPEDAISRFIDAWNIAKTTDKNDDSASRLFLNLGAEMLQFLQSQTEPEYLNYLSKFISEIESQYDNGVIPADCYLRNSDQFLTSRVKVALGAGNPEEAIQILSSNCFPTYGKARKELIAYWQQAQYAVAERAKGSPLTMLEKRNTRVDTPPPRNIGCPYADTYCPHYW